MPFVLKRFQATSGKKIQHFLLEESDLSPSLSQRLLAKNRVFDDKGNTLKSGQIIKGEYIEVAIFEGVTRGLKAIYETDDFAVFDKPSGLMVHPTKKDTPYCLLDEIRYQFGQAADLAHRIDAETSGLVLVAKNKKASTILKTLFENREFSKEYLAIVKGQLKNDITIDKPISKSSSSITIKMTCENKQGKASTTYIQVLRFNKKDNTTLVKAMPVTGRQHQIRVHLDSIGHNILGDPLYGVDEQVANDFLKKTLSEKDRIKLTGAKRLMLHANSLYFTFQDVQYNIVSKKKDEIFS